MRTQLLTIPAAMTLAVAAINQSQAAPERENSTARAEAPAREIQVSQLETDRDRIIFRHGGAACSVRG